MRWGGGEECSPGERSGGGTVLQNERLFCGTVGSYERGVGRFYRAARLKLYQVLPDLGSRVCYYDTDSVIYTWTEGEWEPPLGDFLGQFTNVMDNGDWIETFVAAGHKNYAYRTRACKTCCKVRGITLAFRAAEKVNLESMVNMVESGDPQASITVQKPHKIVRNVSDRTIQSCPQDKLYKIVYNKRVIQPDMSTLPYGY